MPVVPIYFVPVACTKAYLMGKCELLACMIVLVLNNKQLLIASLGAFCGLQLVHNKAFLETGMPTIGICIIVTQSSSMYMACQFASFWYVTSRHMYASTAVIKK